ncbi:proline-rich receptor-like protein kinase PERK13 [Panicum virgatum]|uniref:proline-rich receptor-like protein kinase PERK13 n=1 Tax=Panicum virgatum TaxID=38727 RepID=UPI0019D55A78|nr:proline-rich receptor-like protein kinase PERK13 [Panicum virgatum]
MVYMGALGDGRRVAVKQLKVGAGQGYKKFRAEVDIISRIHHRHLVTLAGCCVTANHRLLVYEFVPNKTLEHHLHGQLLRLDHHQIELDRSVSCIHGAPPVRFSSSAGDGACTACRGEG